MMTKQEIHDNVSGNVVHIRKGLGLTQLEFADYLGLKRSNYGSIEDGRAVSIFSLIKISNFTGISLDTIIKTKMSE